MRNPMNLTVSQSLQTFPMMWVVILVRVHIDTITSDTEMCKQSRRATKLGKPVVSKWPKHDHTKTGRDKRLIQSTKMQCISIGKSLIRLGVPYSNHALRNCHLLRLGILSKNIQSSLKML